MPNTHATVLQSIYHHRIAWRHSISKLAVIAFFLLQGCQPGDKTNQAKSTIDTAMPKPTISDFAPLKEHRIFFMHQSVGKNLMDGLELLSNDANIKIPLSQRENSALHAGFTGNGLIHSYGGKNRFPETKIKSFADQLGRFPENSRPDIAFMKLCYIDFDVDTDIDKLFREYTETLELLERRYPDTTFVHMTVPLMRFPDGIKVSIKRMLGMDVWIDVTNAKRQEFSQRIRERYPENLVFDIAKYESTYPDGMREQRLHHNQTIYGLVPEYTDDGGHLNAQGKRFVARNFLRFLNNLTAVDKSNGNTQTD